MPFKGFFTEYGEANLYDIQEVVGKGSYGVVVAAVDTHTGEKVAIKKINDIFEHVSEATRILREIKLLRLLRHPDIVEIKHIMLPPSHVFHRDLKPKNILANADCKLKICDFGLARASFGDAPSAVFWTDYVATRWYRAPELCGSFFSKYTPAIDIWSIGCIFAEMLTGEPLFPGKNVVDQLDLITDLLGTPSPEAISMIPNEKARRYLSSMRKKEPIPLSQKFPNIDPLALRLLERLIAFDPKDRLSAEEALADPYFYGLANVEDEPSTQPISKIEFEFERRTLTKDDVRELIYREILEYHPQMLQEYLRGMDQIHFMYPSGVDQFKQQFIRLEGRQGKVDRTPLLRRYASLPRERVCSPIDEDPDQNTKSKNQTMLAIRHPCLPSPKKSQDIKGSGVTNSSTKARQGGCTIASYNARCLPRSASISASMCIGIEGAYYCESVTLDYEMAFPISSAHVSDSN
ncbi:UNVERIFIED_CONTAM: Mitogen-activated protein kinase [Sesamum radiatum]|uniref:mitogen-activated protein kinase n=1 Tax=Sesamum radiatum TaxID=300843 RepID=A0AAW2TZP1_SESRA